MEELYIGTERHGHKTKKDESSALQRQERKVLGEITNTSENIYKLELTKKSSNLVTKRSNAFSTVKTRNGIKKIEIRQKIQKIPVPKICVTLNQQERETAVIGRDTVFDVTDYSFDVHNYMLHLEKQHRVAENHLEGQIITPKNRVVLVDWLVRVAEHFCLTPETLQLTIIFIDRYMSVKRDIQKSDFQLLGITALFIAVKYEEVIFTELDDLVHICGDQFTSRDLLHMEMRILKALDFRLGSPVPINFLRRYSKVAEMNTQLHSCSKYLIDLSLHCYALCSYESSKIAAAASFITLCLSRKECNEQLWTENLVSFSSHPLEDIKPVIRLLAEAAAKANLQTTPSVLEKYAKPSYYSVSAQISKYMPLLQDLSSMK